MKRTTANQAKFKKISAKVRLLSIQGGTYQDLLGTIRCLVSVKFSHLSTDSVLINARTSCVG